MKQSKRWSFYFVSSGSSKGKQIKFPGVLFVLFFIIAIASILGFARSIYFCATYGSARFGLYNERKENKELIKKIEFLDKLSEKYDNRIKEIVAFEDNARLKFGMNTINDDIRRAGVGGRPSLEQTINTSLEDPVVRKASLLEEKFSGLFRQVTLQDTTFSRMANHVLMQNDRWAQRPSIWPARGRITSGFGYRSHPFMEIRVFHEGLDIANEVWTPVFATADGIVSFVGIRIFYGTSVMINHRGSGFTTVYAHLEKASVEEGQVVKRGELVGYMGNTGRSTGPHLHYEVRKFNKYDNPMKYILPLDIIVD